MGERFRSHASATWCGFGAATDLAVEAAIAGTGIIQLFEEWATPHLASGALEPILEPWWPRFSDPFLYYSGRRLPPAPLRASVDFIESDGALGTEPFTLGGTRPPSGATGP